MNEQPKRRGRLQQDAVSAADELALSDAERFQARRLKREMDEIGLSGLSEDQCFKFKDVTAKLMALSEGQRLAFKSEIAKLKWRHEKLWGPLKEPTTLKQKQEALSKFREGLDAILRFDRSDDKADVSIRDILLGDYLAPELADRKHDDALVGGHLDVAEWFAGAKKINALAERIEKNSARPSRNRSGWDPSLLARELD